MGRPRRYETRADRQKAYLERKVSGERSIDLQHRELDAEAAEKARASEPGEQLDQTTLVLSEEAYVAEQLALTRAFIKTLRTPEKTTKQAIEDRLRRAEAYARWRYRGFVAGEVVSL